MEQIINLSVIAGLATVAVMLPILKLLRKKEQKQVIPEKKMKLSAKDLPSTPDMKKAYQQAKKLNLQNRAFELDVVEFPIQKKVKIEQVVKFEADDELNKAVNSNESLMESIIEDIVSEDVMATMEQQDEEEVRRDQTPLFGNSTNIPLIVDEPLIIKEIEHSPQLKQNKFSCSPPIKVRLFEQQG